MAAIWKWLCYYLRRTENTGIRIYQLLYLSSELFLLIHGLNFKITSCHRPHKQFTIGTKKISGNSCQFSTYDELEFYCSKCHAVFFHLPNAFAIIKSIIY